MTAKLRIVTKSELRRQARALRAQHAADAPVSFLAALRALPAWTQARTVALCLSAGVEPPTDDLIADCFAAGRRVAVPAWVPDAAPPDGLCVFPPPGAYALAELAPGEPLVPGPFGIPEPARPRWTPSDRIDLFVLPGLLFDRAGTRLGHGRGHLDRLLAGRRPDAFVAGLAFPWQLWPSPLPREPHDVPMDAVLLPDGPPVLAGRGAVC